jgi:hypothetical protein
VVALFWPHAKRAVGEFVAHLQDDREKLPVSYSSLNGLGRHDATSAGKFIFRKNGAGHVFA